MKSLKNLVNKAMLPGLLVLGLYTFDKFFPEVEIPEDKNIKVGTGQLAHSDGKKFRSRRFVSCSAVILDYGESAGFVHAYSDSIPYPDGIQVRSAVEKAWQALDHQNIEPSEVTAIALAGRNFDLETSSSDLKEREFNIREARMHRGINLLTYDPVTNKLEIEESYETQYPE